VNATELCAFLWDSPRERAVTLEMMNDLGWAWRIRIPLPVPSPLIYTPPFRGNLERSTASDR
jgi:hypothetical protein